MREIMKNDEATKAPKVEVSWPKVLLKKWLNLRTTSFNYDRENDTDFDDEDDDDICGCEGDDDQQREDQDGTPKLRRRNSETLRTQYIKTKELRVHIGTWNVGGIAPPDELNIDEWLSTQYPADIYVFGMQEIVPLNAGNVFGAEDRQRVPKWENIIRDALDQIQPVKPKYKCYSDPPSPSRFEPREDVVATTDELLSDVDTDTDDEDEQLFSWDSHTGSVGNDPSSNSCEDGLQKSGQDLDISEQTEIDLEGNVQSSNSCESGPQKQFSMKRFDRQHRLSVVDYSVSTEVSTAQEKRVLKPLSSLERIGLIWPEPPLDLVAKHASNDSNSLRSKSFRTYNSFRSATYDDAKKHVAFELVPDFDLTTRRQLRKRPAFVRIISKQMVGIYLSIWVRRGLRRHIQNLNVSAVGVGAMGYIGNKGSIAVSMSVYQTLFCFVCSHLSSGEKPGDGARRNADVQEIHHKTEFGTGGDAGLPRTIYDHERIFWLGDLNYRIDLSYDKIHELISKKNWSLLAESDQLMRELKKGRAFDDWSEGVINFPPTYKYEFNSTNYIKDGKRSRRRRPAWCDRVLSFGKGVRLQEYRRSELNLSDHRPVCANFAVEVEEFCHRKLQRALTLTKAEVQRDDIVWGL